MGIVLFIYLCFCALAIYRRDGVIFFLGILVSALIVCIILCVTLCVWREVPQQQTFKGSTPLVSFIDHRSLSGGGGFLLVNPITEKPEYLYYYEVEAGFVKQGSVRVAKALVKESDIEKPRIETYVVELEWQSYLYLAPVPVHHRTLYKIYVPTGTIVRKFNMGLE